LALILGFKTRLAAVLLLGFTIVAAVLAHSFWAVPVEQYQAQYINFFKNIAICGGLLYVFVHGAGPISIDRR
jgi:putative oxidoreductase